MSRQDPTSFERRFFERSNTSYLPLGLAVLGMAVAIYGAISAQQIAERKEQARLAQVALMRQNVEAARSEVIRLRSDFDAVVKSLSSAKTPDEALALDRLDKRVAALEEGLQSNAAKSLAVPMMRKDIDNLAERYRSDLDAVRGETSRLVGVMQWGFGAIVTLSLGLAGLGVNLIRRTDPSKQSHSDNDKIR